MGRQRPCLRRWRHEEGLRRLKRAGAMSPELKGVHLELARIWYSLREYEQAIECCQKELDRYPDCPFSMQIAGAASHKLREYAQAIDLLLDSAAIRFRNPLTHYYLGAAFHALGQPENAIQAFEHVVKASPNNTAAHRYLSRLYSDVGKPDESRLHGQQSVLRRRERKSSNQTRRERASQTWPIPDLPSPEERAEQLRKNRPVRKSESKARERSGKTFVLVSGLPRSGTSLMMQMLQAGGLHPMTDGVRTADEDNPEGYLEW